MREWLVGGGLILDGDHLLMVRNRRRDGGHDWTPPGGVIEDGETVAAGLCREVAEETGVEVGAWEGPVYEVVVDARDMGWRARVEVHLALSHRGPLEVDDPDGVVSDALWVRRASCPDHLVGCHPWVREPLLAWLEGPGGWTHRTFAYVLRGADPATAVLTRTHPGP